MKITIQTKDVILTAKQKAMVERKMAKFKKFILEEPAMIDLHFTDESSPEKGGIDQAVHINATFGKEKIFIEEVDDRMMRAFAFALKRFERQLSRYHHRKIAESQHGGGGRLEKVWKIVKRKKSNAKNNADIREI